MIVFKTDRLYVRKTLSNSEDVNNYFKLWNSGEVMKFVSFPEGLGISKEEIREKFENYGGSIFDRTLAVFKKKTDEFIGECKLGSPNKEGISTTDVKLLPKFWGNSFGKEIKIALCDYLFKNTDCQIVEASPNKFNIASQKMQKFCGGKFVRDELYEPPKDSVVPRTNVYSYIYHIKKEDFYAEKRSYRSKKLT